MSLSNEIHEVPQLQIPNGARTTRRRALGALAAGVAHEINNPLSCVYSNLAQIQAYYKVFQPVIDQYQREMGQMTNNSLANGRLSKLESMLGEFSEILEDSKFACEQIDNVVRDLHLYASLYKESFGILSLNEIVESVQQRLKDERPSLLGLKVELETDLPPIFAEAATLEKVVMRLVQRAFHSVESITHPEVRVLTYRESAEVCIRVCDNGIGIPNEYRDSIFDPFFLDPSCIRGSNMSLALGRIAIEELGGSISVAGEYGSGCEFTISFPGEAI